jgi:hypothetical protein
MSKADTTYNASMILSRFHRSDAFYRGIMGPVGSGKSTACCWEVMTRAQRQQPGEDGIRRSRFAVVRNTYRELQDTTIKTWQDWFPVEQFGGVRNQTMSQNIKGKLSDGTVFETEILFRALDRPDDVKKVLSLEITGAWVNEAREVPKGIIDGLGDRVGRYPSRKDGGCTWRGVIMDTNPPDDDHWWYRLSEEERPDGWEFFRQPGGLIEVNGKFIPNENAENLDNLEPNYYVTRQAGKTSDYIKIYYCGQYGFVMEGKVVFPEYVDNIHCAAEIIKPAPGQTVYVGLDFGLTPAALFCQRLPDGRWAWIDEIVTQDMGISRFADILGPKLRGEYADFKIEIWGDPAGQQRSQNDEKTMYQILRAKGLDAKPAPSNVFTLRREAVASPMTRLIDGKPGFIISPKCKVARKGLAGGYYYHRVKIANDERYKDEPEKNWYSHIVEAGGYAMLGAGEGRNIIGKPRIKITPIKTGRLSHAGGWMGS